MTAPTLIKYKTECMLCHQTQHNPPLDIPLVSEPGKAVADFLQKLLSHIGKKHFAELNQGRGLLQQYQTFLLLSQFQSEDPSFMRVLEGMRADIFQRCRRNVPTNADLDLLASKCEFSTPEDAKRARDAMQSIRDFCCELGAAAPTTPQSSIA